MMLDQSQGPIATEVSQGAVKRANRIGILAVVVSFAAFLAWASFAPLAQGVAAQGTVMLDTKRKQVQHPSGGILREILVKEGQTVKEGEVLMRLDPVQTRANLETTLQQYLGYRALESRLLAEKSGANAVEFHPSLYSLSSGPNAVRHRENQQQLFESRKTSRLLDLKATDEAIAGLEASLKGTEGGLEARRLQAQMLAKELESTRGLAVDGFAALQRVRELERSVADTRGSIMDLEANRLRIEQTIQEQRSRRELKLKDFLRDVNQQLTDVQKEVEAIEERLKANQAEMDRIVIKAPVAGQVVGLTIQTVGGVVTGSQKLMDIVPSQEDLLIEAKVPPNFIDRVKAGQHVDVRFTTFANTPQLVVEGSLESISTDAIDASGALSLSPTGFNTFYLGRVRLTKFGVEKLQGRQLQAGMPVEVVIKTGERSVLKYLLHPIIKRMASSMIEE